MSSSSTSKRLTLPVWNDDSDPGSMRTRPANAGSLSCIDSLPPRGPCGIAAIDSLATISLLAHAAVERPGGTGGGVETCARMFGPLGDSSVCASGFAFGCDPDEL